MNDPTQVLEVVRYRKTRVWIENCVWGDRTVVVQHEGDAPFQYATFGYDYRYTDNATTYAQARRLALELGAEEPVEERFCSNFPPRPTAVDLRLNIEAMQKQLKLLDDGEQDQAGAANDSE